MYLYFVECLKNKQLTSIIEEANIMVVSFQHFIFGLTVVLRWLEVFNPRANCIEFDLIEFDFQLFLHSYFYI